MTKTDAIRDALDDLGKKAKPLQLQEHIRSKFGMEISTSHISSSKTGLVKNGAGKGKRGRKPKAPGTPASTSAPAGRDSDGISVEDVRVVKELTHRIGADKVRALTDLLAK